MIRTMSKKQSMKISLKDKLKAKMGKLRNCAKLKLKHLSSMTERWKRLRLKVKVGAALNIINRDIQKKKKSRKDLDGDLTLTQMQDILREETAQKLAENQTVDKAVNQL